MVRLFRYSTGLGFPLVLAAYRYAATYLSTFKSPPVRHADTFQYYLSTYLANVFWPKLSFSECMARSHFEYDKI